MSYPPQQPEGHQPDPQQQRAVPGQPDPQQPYPPQQQAAPVQPFAPQQPFPAAGGFAGAAQQLAPPPKRKRWLQILVGVVAAAAIGVAILMFTGSRVVIDDQKIKESAITILQREGIEATLSDFECPEDMPAEEGATYTCTASEDGVDLKITVDVQDTDGTVNVEVFVAG